MTKYHDIVEKIDTRVRHGDYRLRGFPSHTDLVSELRVNSRTVTRALNELVGRGILVRQDTGRFCLPEENSTALLHVGILAPAYPSSMTTMWHHTIDKVVQERGWSLKYVAYTHWHDAAISDAMRGLDGAFFLPRGDDFPVSILEEIKHAAAPVVVLEQDLSSHRLPSLRLTNPASIHILLDHLYRQGHRRIACLNTQQDNPVILERIDAWKLWMATRQLNGLLIDEPVELFKSSIEKACSVISEKIRSGALDATAIFCTTDMIAIGAMRAIHEQGMKVGPDISVCAPEDWAGLSEFLTPSLTCLKTPSPEAYIRVCMEWFARGGRRDDWIGSLLIQPPDTILFEGESTQSVREDG